MILNVLRSHATNAMLFYALVMFLFFAEQFTSLNSHELVLFLIATLAVPHTIVHLEYSKRVLENRETLLQNEKGWRISQHVWVTHIAVALLIGLAWWIRLFLV